MMETEKTENIKETKILLASGSPRRREILASLGLKFDVAVTECDESVPIGTSPEDTVRMLAERKAAAAFENAKDSLVIGSDTVVYLEGEDVILGKPSDREDAVRMLKLLSGRRHYVYTGVALVSREVSVTGVSVAAVDFEELSDDEINGYIDTGECFDKAGSYGIQDIGGIFVKGIEGDYFNVMGLPKSLTAKLLKKCGIDILKYNKK